MGRGSRRGEFQNLPPLPGPLLYRMEEREKIMSLKEEAQQRRPTVNHAGAWLRRETRPLQPPRSANSCDSALGFQPRHRTRTARPQ